jgi:putative FmdB family regulatory protein
MPKYSFTCESCRVRFERTLKMGEHKTHPCPTCKAPSPRQFENFGFGFEAGKGAEQANTGVHDLDYPSADKIVGRSAESRWSTYRERDKVKKQVREVGGSQALIRTNGQNYVEYEAMGEPRKEARSKLVDQAVAIERATKPEE